MSFSTGGIAASPGQPWDMAWGDLTKGTARASETDR